MMFKTALATTALLLTSTAAFAATDPALDKVLRQLDAASAKFQSTEAEPISDGASTVTVDKLDLIPKDPGVKSSFTHVVIWIDPARGVSLKQEYTTPESDKRTVTYSHLRYNAKVDTKKYALPKK